MMPDPLHLLKREHELILDHLRMIETTVAPSLLRHHAPTEPEWKTLRELFRFFTGRVAIHFNREAVLMAALGRSFGRERSARQQFEGLRREHRALRTDAVAIRKRLKERTAAASEVADIDPCRIRSFVQRYRAQLSCEERILFVLADLRLTAEQRRQISHRMLQI